MTKPMTKAEARRRLRAVRRNIRELELRQKELHRSLGPNKAKLVSLQDSIRVQAHYATVVLERAGLAVPDDITDRRRVS